MKFKPAVVVNDILISDPSQNRRTLAGAAKTLLVEEEADERHQQLCSLSTQGEMARQWRENSPELWVRAVQGLPPEPMKFALNASLDILPTNGNLYKWGKKTYYTCPLCCESRQSLVHILNNCPMAMTLRRYSRRHDEVLQVLGGFVQAHLPPTFSFTIDLPSVTYTFPHHITPTDMRPDVVWWSDEQKKLWLLELTISYESLVAETRQRKCVKYQDLVEAGQAAGYRTELITIEVGSRGMLSANDFDVIKSAVSATHKEVTSLVEALIRTTLLESFRIWGSRNSVH